MYQSAGIMKTAVSCVNGYHADTGLLQIRSSQPHLTKGYYIDTGLLHIRRMVNFLLIIHCIALHCIALHCIALHCIALHCILLH